VQGRVLAAIDSVLLAQRVESQQAPPPSTEVELDDVVSLALPFLRRAALLKLSAADAPAGRALRGALEAERAFLRRHPAGADVEAPTSTVAIQTQLESTAEAAASLSTLHEVEEREANVLLCFLTGADLTIRELLDGETRGWFDLSLAALADAWGARLATCAPGGGGGGFPTLVPMVDAQLALLPRAYGDIFEATDAGGSARAADFKRCARCGSVPKDPGVCLLCGTLVCIASQCCRTGTMGELSRHAWECNGGHGIFLMLKHSSAILVHDGLIFRWPSPYLDEHGEEDPELRRGRPLFLSKARLQRLRELLLTHQVTQTVVTKVNELYRFQVMARNHL
jgi:hypothetical protein